jgi:molecular chaperone HtpG
LDTATVADYKARMKEGRDAIYYITMKRWPATKNNPQLKSFAKGIEECCDGRPRVVGPEPQW